MPEQGDIAAAEEGRFSRFLEEVGGCSHAVEGSFQAGTHLDRTRSWATPAIALSKI